MRHIIRRRFEVASEVSHGYKRKCHQESTLPCHSKDSTGDITLLEHVIEPPEASPTPIFIERLHVEVALPNVRCAAYNFRK